MPVPAHDDHSFSPSVARYAMKSPAAVPWNTRLPAVASVPPFQYAPYSAVQRGLRATGSHAISRPAYGTS